MDCWKVETVGLKDLEKRLNEVESTHEIFAVVPTLSFKNTTVVVATVPLPTEILYHIVAKKRKA